MTAAFPFIPAATPAPPVIPYITCSEYRTAVTAIDTYELVTLGTPPQQNAALYQKIAAASSWADQICYQILAATSDTETGIDVYVRRDGTIRVPLRYWPVLEVDAISVGATPSTVAPLADTTNVWLSGRNGAAGPLVVPICNATLPVGYLRPWISGRAYCSITYVNGWPNTTMTGPTLAGAVTIPVWSTFGFYPGRTYKICDVTGGVEQFTVTSVTTGTLHTTPLVYAHTPLAAPDGIGVSGLPDAVKQAVVLLTSQLIKTRGAEAIVMETVGGTPSKMAPSDSGGFDDYQMACRLLSSFARVA